MKGDVRKTAMLRRRLAESRDLLCKAETAREDGYSGSDRWIEHHRSTVERYSKLNSIMEDPTVPEGAVIQLAPPIAPIRIKQEKVRRLPAQTDDAQVGLPAEIRALMEE
ncbi:hypothetical protein KKQ55_31585 [Pseudomonas aeruginosa]|uniref:hypothetical protein n=1 Tax=Pseudomonas aeruginosa TaxID=287 RepID=UPI0022EA55F4|nr:hypothetical protein [Pseudomonas aeruginosa]MDA3393908.1 hypothetical protein [Pseudomonas aeruginosa]